MATMAAAVVVASGLGFALVTGIARAAGTADVINSEQNQETYYYPELTSREVYTARATVLPDATRASRLAFVTGLTQQQLSKPYPPTFAIFAKGSEAEKLIIVSLGDFGFRTLYQARGVLAQLSAVARTSTMFRQMKVEDIFTFLDLARLLGFTEVTISDGETFAHQIKLE
ncbi:MAG TPA: hypothetical protein VEU47_02955 [Candidatus Cybelea sp.]|nr:hypothetical protein [Candidatus Cybelea sp.]